jgi:predicted negative regulator of RcsB-dependent stress response
LTTEYMTEQEQIELLKNWIKQYSLVILAGVLVASVAIFGWRTWQERQYRILSHASAIYDEMLTLRAQNNAGATLIQAQKLFDHYPKTTYGQLAALMLARDAAKKKDYENATHRLNWVLKHSGTSSIRQIARLRLARVQLAEQQPAESIKTLAAVEDNSFSGLINEERGDAFYTMKETKKARDAYQQALNDLPNADVIRPLLQMKYDNLATTD